ncbi:hypothetical protein J6590_039356 [Homalodisca vitripennis]|nr:hypothetical protein J6590_039356 [Homalodisca vitripennis]
MLFYSRFEGDSVGLFLFHGDMAGISLLIRSREEAAPTPNLTKIRIPYTWLRQHRCRRITAGFNLMHIQAVAELLSLSSEVALTPIFSYINPDGT